MNRIRRSLALASSLALAGVIVVPQIARASQAASSKAPADHAVAGTVKKVDAATKTMVIHTTEGVDETVKFTEKTTVSGAKDVAHASDATAKASLEGTSVVLHYTSTGADKTAVSVDHASKGALKVTKATVVRVDEGGKFVVVKTAAGAEETYDLSKDVVVDSGKGVEHGAAKTGSAIKKGDEVTVHYSEDAGKKIVHLLKHL